MSTFPVEPPVTPAAPTPEAGGAAHRRELSQEEIATLPLQALLVRAGHITLDQLADALRENVATGRAVEDIALSRGWLSADQLDALRTAKQSYAPGAPAPAVEAPAAPAPVAPTYAAPAPAPAPAPVVEAPVAPAPVAPPPAAQAPPPPAPVVEAPPPARSWKRPRPPRSKRRPRHRPPFSKHRQNAHRPPEATRRSASS